MTTTMMLILGLLVLGVAGVAIYILLGQGNEVRMIDPSKQEKTRADKAAEALKANNAKTAQLSALRDKLAEQSQSSAAPLKKPAAGKGVTKSTIQSGAKKLPLIKGELLEAPQAGGSQDGQPAQNAQGEPESTFTLPVAATPAKLISDEQEGGWTPNDAFTRGALPLTPQAAAESARLEEATMEATSIELAQAALGDGADIFPAQPDLAPQLPPSLSGISPVSAPPAKTHILLVDDSKVVRVKTEKLLVNMGYEVSTALDGLDALAKLETIKPDLIITDIEMPNLDGFGLVRSVRKNLRTSEIPIIVMTSHVNLHLDIAATEGINGFLPKPFIDQDLLDQVSFLSQE